MEGTTGSLDVANSLTPMMIHYDLPGACPQQLPQLQNEALGTIL